MRIYAALLLWLAGSASAGSVTCVGISGTPFDAAYSGTYTTPDASAVIDLKIDAGNLFALVELDDDRKFIAFTSLQPGTLQFSIPLWSATGDFGSITMCATHNVKLGAVAVAIFVNGAFYTGPQLFYRVDPYGRR